MQTVNGLTTCEKPEGEHLIVAQGGNCPSARQWFGNLWKPWGGASHSCERPKLPLRLPLFGPAEQALWYGQVIRTNGTIRRIRARESTVLVSTCCVDHRYRSFLLCVAWWGARGESGLRNFERLPSQVFSYLQIWTGPQELSWKSKYEQVPRIYPEKEKIYKISIL